MPNGSLTRVEGVTVGHATDPERTTGVTAIRFDGPVPCAIEVPGGAACTYDTASLSLESTFGRRWAIFFAGGSVHGLDAARGVRNAVLEGGGGRPVFGGSARIAPISGATIYDLRQPQGPSADYLPLGYEATHSASTRPVPFGQVGAGTGATVGKYLGRGKAMPGGLGSGAGRVADAGNVGVLVVVNAVGAVRGRDGRWIAGARRADGTIVAPDRAHRPTVRRDGDPGTTLVAVACDVPLERRELARVAILAASGLARVVIPAHAAVDGDVVFAASTRPDRPRPSERFPGELSDRVGRLAADLVALAAEQAVSTA